MCVSDAHFRRDKPPHELTPRNKGQRTYRYQRVSIEVRGSCLLSQHYVPPTSDLIRPGGLRDRVYNKLQYCLSTPVDE